MYVYDRLLCEWVRNILTMFSQGTLNVGYKQSNVSEERDSTKNSWTWFWCMLLTHNLPYSAYKYYNSSAESTIYSLLRNIDLLDFAHEGKATEGHVTVSNRAYMR